MELKEQAVELYLSGFPDDSREFAIDFIQSFFDNHCCYIEEDGKLISMLFMFDCDLVNCNEKLPISYIYAVVTDTIYRGKGYMRKLMEKAAEKSKDKAALIIKPSNEGLYSFYEKLGFKTTFYYDEYEYFGKKSSDKKLDFITFKEYSTKREQLLKNTPHVCWENMMEYIGLGGEFFKGEDFCGLVEKTNNKLFLREFIGNEEGIDALLLNLDYKSAVIRVTENKTPFGMLRPLKSENFPEKMYMGFAMD